MDPNFYKNSVNRVILVKEYSLSKLLLGHKDKINALKFDFHSRIFATASSDQTIRLWESNNYKNFSILKGHSSAVRCIFFYKKFPYIFSGGEDQTIRSWDIEYNRSFRIYSGHFGAIIKLAYHPIIDVFFSCSKDNTIRIWDLRTNKQIQIIHFPSKIVTSIAVHPESPHLITSSRDKKLGFWDLISGKCYEISPKPAKEILQIENNSANFSFFTLSPDALINWRNDGLIYKKFKNIFSSNKSFCLNNENQIALAFSSGWIKIFNYYKAIQDIDFFFPSKFLKKKKDCNHNLHLSFNYKNDNLLVAGIDKSIKIFKKNWKVKIKKKNSKK